MYQRPVIIRMKIIYILVKAEMFKRASYIFKVR